MKKKLKIFWSNGQTRSKKKCQFSFIKENKENNIFKTLKYFTIHPESYAVYDLMFGLTVCELLSAKVASALRNQKFVMRDNSKTISLIVLKFSQSYSEAKVTPGTNFRQNLRHEGAIFEKSCTIIRGMPHMVYK